MKTFLAEEYKKQQKNLLDEVKKWRQEHPQATPGDAIRVLYEEFESRE